MAAYPVAQEHWHPAHGAQGRRRYAILNVEPGSVEVASINTAMQTTPGHARPRSSRGHDSIRRAEQPSGPPRLSLAGALRARTRWSSCVPWPALAQHREQGYRTYARGEHPPRST
jgi:hypothetical protein